MSGVAQLVAAYGNIATPGQAVLTAGASWVVPDGVYRISMVGVECGEAVGTPNTNGTTVSYGGVMVLRAKNGVRIGTGGGDGGLGGPFGFIGPDPTTGGGGGAGGYAGNGGHGGGVGQLRANGSGGGGAGGDQGYNGTGAPPASGAGGGVGLLGLGTSGAVAGQGGSGGANASGPNAGAYGGGGGTGASEPGRTGGALAYLNDLLVAPGQVLTVVVDLPTGGSNGGAGALRIMWGGNRSYPSNAGDM